jgi:A/G-specific adenine glycosylase
VGSDGFVKREKSGAKTRASSGPKPRPTKGDKLESLHHLLLEWFDTQARVLPWRDAPAGSRDPYRTLLSEILLQQTQVSRGAVYFERFVAAFPTIQDLADARLEAVLKRWEGAGYYARARNLHRAAQIIARDGVPNSLEGWLALPGIGRYTAGAISSLAQNARHPVVDGNVRRVLARWLLEPNPSAEWLWERATMLLPPIRPGAWNEALIELGAVICTPKNPRCSACPVSSHCAAFQAARVHEIPAPKPRAVVTEQRVVALLATRGEGVLLEQRPPSGLLGGLYGVPLEAITTTREAALETLLARFGLTVTGAWAGKVTHSMTHRKIELEVYRVTLEDAKVQGNEQLRLETPGDVALSRLDHKVLACGTTVQLALF